MVWIPEFDGLGGRDPKSIPFRNIGSQLMFTCATWTVTMGLPQTVFPFVSSFLMKEGAGEGLKVSPGSSYFWNHKSAHILSSIP